MYVRVCIYFIIYMLYVCRYVFMYVWMCVYIYVGMYVCIWAWMMYKYLYMFVWKNIFMYVFVYLCMDVYIYILIRTWVLYVFLYTRLYVCVYEYVYECVFDYTGCFTTLGHNCRRWFPRTLCSKKVIYTCVRFWTFTELWPFFNSRTRPRVNRVHRFSQLLTNYTYLRRAGKGGVLTATRSVHNRAAACVAPGGAFSKIKFKQR